MPLLDILVILVVLGALLFDFSNGWHDCANAVATIISTRVLPPLLAIALAAVLNFAGALAGQAVARTIFKGVVNVDALQLAGPAAKMVPLLMTLAAVLTAILWNIATVVRGLPASSTHAIVGGLMGAGIAAAHWSTTALQAAGLKKVFLFLVLAPLLGLAAGFVFMWMLTWLLHRATPAVVSRLFGKLQLLSVSYMAFSHGQNDAQKAMGIITLALYSTGKIATPDIPTWVILACALAMAVGTASGGKKVIHTLGMGLLKLQPVHGFAAETAAASVLVFTAHAGLPVSTTHVITSAIMGVGATRRLSAVRWGLGKKILYAWVLTFPVTLIVSALLFVALRALFLR